ncbi:Uncharacterised protein [Trueperella bialowiezensis]|uniref:Uncharacterized protein n=1 Tax=Trueperella bialowiezensis TaxID=312285 RepID=A0A448PF18_9ACTO|nr:Uncharacterised protein [Trueperella bialowiezensis]
MAGEDPKVIRKQLTARGERIAQLEAELERMTDALNRERQAVEIMKQAMALVEKFSDPEAPESDQTDKSSSPKKTKPSND